VKFLAFQRQLALAHEDVVGNTRGGREPRGIDHPGAIEKRALDAERLLAKPRAGRVVEPVVVARIADRGRVHGRQFELSLEVFLDQRIER
jgi:hypothetical protein